MKALTWIAAAAALLSACSPLVIQTYTPPPEQQQPVYADQQPENYPDQDIESDQIFYDQLAPYGQWINYPDYGYVWQPNNVDPDFRPYETEGQWVYSDYGWTWASDYDWGWAPFHYGRWFYDDNYGWLWAPGHQWAPAWVTWCRSGDYYGWAPIAPRVDIAANSNWRPADNAWSFVPARHINNVNVRNYVVHNNTAVINNITIINNYHNTVVNNPAINNTTINNNTAGHGHGVYNQGPRVSEVEGITKTKIQPLQINTTTQPGASTVNNNRLVIYKPVVNPGKQKNAVKAAPRNVQAYRPAAQPVRINQQNQPVQQNNPNPYRRGNNLQGAQPENSRQRPAVPAANTNPPVQQTPNQYVKPGAVQGNQPANNGQTLPKKMQVQRPPAVTQQGNNQQAIKPAVKTNPVPGVYNNNRQQQGKQKNNQPKRKYQTKPDSQKVKPPNQ